MSIDRWKQIDGLFDAALELPSNERGAFLEVACGGDGALRREVESLLVAHSKAKNFIETPAMELAAKAVAEQKRHNLIGQGFGPYSVLKLLGKGGMGEVYLAKDTRLGRKIALKLLPGEFTHDQIRVARFAREAKAASALNHPNILTIHEIGQIDDNHFIAAEFIEGETLGTLVRQKGLKINQLIDIGAQVASALQAAHGAGIVHRDIKPDNIMIRPDGFVKVLDFGLAKLSDFKSTLNRLSNHPKPATLSSPGVIMGTAHYMAPEQAMGEEIDQRADLFSLGVVLYEAATGEKPFAGQKLAAVLDAIVRETPRLPSSVSDAVPPELERIILKALEKDANRRYQSAAEMQIDLRRMLKGMESGAGRSSSSTAPPVAPPAERRASRIKIGIAVAGAVTLVSAALFFSRMRGDRFVPSWNTATALQLTGYAGREVFPSISPDGTSFVYSRKTPGRDDWDIFRQRIGGGREINLTPNSPDDDWQATFSPDGNSIAFRSERGGGGLFVMGATGESVRRVSNEGYYPNWSPDGRFIVYTTEFFPTPQYRSGIGRLWVVNVETGEKRLVGTPGDAVQPAWSPDGRRIAYWSWNRDAGGQRDVWTVGSDGSSPVQVTSDPATDWNPAWSPAGDALYFISDRTGNATLWRVPVDESSGKVLGPPVPAAGPSLQCDHVTLAKDGKKLIFVRSELKQSVVSVGFDALAGELSARPSALPLNTKDVGELDLSPDGKWLTFTSSRETREDVCVASVDGREMRRLTEDDFRDRTPKWSPDGKQIAFYSNAGGIYDLWRINVDGSGRERLTFSSAKGLAYPFWSPDGKRIGCNILGGQLCILDAESPEKRKSPFFPPFVNDAKDWMVGWRWSSDGGKIAGWRSGTKGESEDVLVFDLGTGKYEEFPGAGTRPAWLSDNRRLLACKGRRIFLIDLQAKKSREIFSFPFETVQSLAISRDDRTIFMTVVADDSDLTLLSVE